MIDTLKVAEQLKENGFDDQQARSITNAIASSNEQLATKQDIQSVRQDMRQETQSIRQDIQGVRQDTKTNRWLIGLSLLLNTVAISGIIAILISVAN